LLAYVGADKIAYDFLLQLVLDATTYFLLRVVTIHYFGPVSDATSDMVSALESNLRSEDSGAKSNFLSSEVGQQRVRSLSDSRSDGHKKQSETFDRKASAENKTNKLTIYVEVTARCLGYKNSLSRSSTRIHTSHFYNY